ncbi:MAG TPA: peptide chain release factor N(5)-glutamine methyltransferase [bacterium]
MPKPSKIWKVLELLNWGCQYLSEKGFENARLNTERLLGHSLNLNRVDLYLNFERPLTADELERFKGLLKRRLRREPLQYILGETEFFSLRFQVNSEVLIPRPETEVLVETILKFCGERFASERALAILDIGTGSGCIAVALAKHLPNARITAIDVSDAALTVASENARRNEVAGLIEFRKLDFFSINLLSELADEFNAIVSNPPYISDAEFSNLPQEVRDFEPRAALKDGVDGLNFYRQIAAIVPMILGHGGLVAVEVGLGQAQPVEKIFSTLGFAHIQAIADLNGIDRVVYADK